MKCNKCCLVRDEFSECVIDRHPIPCNDEIDCICENLRVKYLTEQIGDQYVVTKKEEKGEE